MDITQQFNVARAVNYRGIVIGDSLTFENDEIGFARLQEWMNELKDSKGYRTTAIPSFPTPVPSGRNSSRPIS